MSEPTTRRVMISLSEEEQKAICRVASAHKRGAAYSVDDERVARLVLARVGNARGFVGGRRP